MAGGSYETIPMEVFEISEANRKAKCLEIKAYYALDLDNGLTMNLGVNLLQFGLEETRRQLCENILADL